MTATAKEALNEIGLWPPFPISLTPFQEREKLESDPHFTDPLPPLGPEKVILDTNIILDTFVFNDPAAKPLLGALQSGSLRWIATAPMREELERVLAYPKIVKRLGFYQLEAAEVLVQFDTLVQTVDVAAKAPIVCKDPDDQKFIDLAVAHQALVLSKDNAVLCMKKRLLALGAEARCAINSVAPLVPLAPAKPTQFIPAATGSLTRSLT